MKFFTSLFVIILSLSAYSQGQPVWSVNAVNNQFNITCANPTVNLYISAGNYTGAITTVWSGPGPVSVNGASAAITSPGNYTVKILYDNTVMLVVIPVDIDTILPNCTANALSVTITNSTPPLFTFTAISPTTNIIHNIYVPGQQAPIVSTGSIAYYDPAGSASGTYTHCLVNTINGCQSCRTFTINYPLSSEDRLSRGKSLTIFPNPNNGLFHIKSEKSDIAGLEIINSLGTLVYQDFSFSNERVIDFSNQTKGMYVVKLLSKDKREFFFKMIIE